VASQRLTLAKVGGVAADAIVTLTDRWAAARSTTDPDEWSPDQWPSAVRRQADDFADRLRAHGCTPPVVHFVEWSDLWSMGDVFGSWLAPPGGPQPLWVCGDRYEIRGYDLPDGGRLQRHLAGAGPRWAAESELLVKRLGEALTAWNGVVERAVLILLREVVGGLVTDGELAEALEHVPAWLIEDAA
jgi:hypothetical protein